MGKPTTAVRGGVACGSRRRAAAVCAAATLAALLAGCGRKGDLEPALDPSVTAPTSAGDSAAPVIRRSRRVPITPPKEPFILDPIL